ncbi:MAG TPA: tRNA (adenosine(37)-N6)-dimethylallyltransferase MiaA [Candidatus Acidoferrales bacterium]|nr:tRNA (adenosine(37)-N6)-dimethylallyltransferase MiaA [Candidatus Acidoferrales bacterium]
MSGPSLELAPLIVVLGPTASGKSALGIELARRFDAEVVVCDSTQVYRHFDIGTAKIPASEQHGVPHHLTDLVEPDEVFTAGEYRRRAIAVLDDLKRRRKLPVLTAGTGLYLRALLEGLADAPERSEELRSRLRAITERRGPEYLHHLLARIDPEAAKKVAVRDAQKVIRAVEIRTLARQTVGEVHRSGREALQGFRVTKIGLLPNRKALYAHIEARTRDMVASGWLAEVRALVARGSSPDAKPFQFIGYRELKDHLEGKISLEEAVRSIQQATRQFAKRQITWFRREPDVHWLEGFGADAKVIDRAVEIVANGTR